MADRAQQDVLALRAQKTCVETTEVVKLLTEYGKSCVAKAAEGRRVSPELVRRMKMLVNQEFRIMEYCAKFEAACADLLEGCGNQETVSDEQLQPSLTALTECLTDIADLSRERKDNIRAILEAERASLEEFAALHRRIQDEKSQVQFLGHLGTAITVALAAAASSPVGIVACVVAGIAMRSSTAQHSDKARKVQEALQEDMDRINGPIQRPNVVHLSFAAV